MGQRRPRHRQPPASHSLAFSIFSSEVQLFEGDSQSHPAVCGSQAVSSARWPLLSETARLLFLQACCTVAEGADVPLSHADAAPDAQSPPDVCVGAVLGDALRRVSALGDREGMPRSLGSVYGGSVTRFLGGGLRGVVSRVIDTAHVMSDCNGMAVSRDGTTLLVSDSWGGSHAIHEYSVADGAPLRVIGGYGDGPLRFHGPRQVHIASDGFVFVAECFNSRVQVLTPALDFHGFVGVGALERAVGVCVDADVVVVSEGASRRITVFDRAHGAVLRRFTSGAPGDRGFAGGLCLLSRGRLVAATDYLLKRVSVCTVDGAFVRDLGVGDLEFPTAVACSAFDELVVDDDRRVVVLDASGGVAKALGQGTFACVAVHGCTVFAAKSVTRHRRCCVVFT